MAHKQCISIVIMLSCFMSVHYFGTVNNHSVRQQKASKEIETNAHGITT